MEFIIPAHPEDLEIIQPNRFYVKEVWNVEECTDVDTVIEDLSNKILNASDIFTVSLDNTVFDKLYSLIKFWPCHNGTTKQHIMELLYSFVQDILSNINDSTILASNNSHNPEINRRRTAFKAIAYIYVISVQVADKTSVPASIAMGGKETKKGKKSTASHDDIMDDNINDDENKDPNENTNNQFDWNTLRESYIRLLNDILLIDMRKLWSLGVPDEEFLSIFMRTGLRILTCNYSMKDKNARYYLSIYLANLCYRFPSIITSTVAALVDACIKHEHTSAIVGEIIQVWSITSTDNNTSTMYAPHVIAEVLQELGRLNSTSDTKDTAGLRRAATLIMDISERVPTIVLNNMSILLPYIDSDSYTLRSALVTTLANIVAKSFNSATAAATTATNNNSETPIFNTKTRNELLDVLLERVYDVNSYTRAAVLRGWIILANATAIPLSYYSRITTLATDRLRDKGAQVRKQAGQLLRILLENNPFGPSIDPNLFAIQIKASETWLANNATDVWNHMCGIQTPNPSSTTNNKKGLQSIAEDENTEENNIDEELIADAEKNGDNTSSEEIMVTPEAARYVQAREISTAGIKFAQAITASITTLGELLSSKTGSDVMEAIKCLATARAFSVPNAETTLARMLVLVWTEGPVREEVIDTFDKLYILNEALDNSDDNDNAWNNNNTNDEGENTNDDTVIKSAKDTEEIEELDDLDDEVVPTKASKTTKAKSASNAAAAETSAPRRSGRATKPVSMKEEGDSDNDDDDDDFDGATKKPKKKAAPKIPKGEKKATTASSSTTTVTKKKSSTSNRSNIDPQSVAEALVRLLTGASLAVRTSLEEVIKCCTIRNLLPIAVFDCLWDIVGYGVVSLARTRIAIGSHVATVANTPDVAIDTAPLQSQIQAMYTTLQRARTAMCILGMAAAAIPATIDSTTGLARIYAILHPTAIPGFPQGSQLFEIAQALHMDTSLIEPALCIGDYRFARHACAALQRFVGNSLVTSPKKIMANSGTTQPETTTVAPPKVSTKGKKGADPVDTAEQQAEKRQEVIQHILSAIASMIRGDWDGGNIENPHWYAATQQGIDAIFILAAQPAILCTSIIQYMATQTFITSVPNTSIDFTANLNRTRLGRLFFVLGHVAMKLLVHVEALSTSVKLLRIKASERAEHAHATNENNQTNSKTAAKGKKEANNKNSASNDGIEEQLGVSAAEDEKEAELVVQIAEKELVAANLGGLFAPLLSYIARTVLTNTNSTTSVVDEPLAQSALLALCKLCAVSSDFCEKQLQLLFTVLSHATSPRIRSVIIIALGDLAFRFPNLIEPYTSHLYARLRDTDTGVRKNTLMVLTHLILNDMVKVKGQVGEIAICLNDPDTRIADLTRLFFNELSKRANNPIYNILPDTLSCLSKLANENITATITGTANVHVNGIKGLDAETFRDVVRFLLGFINKDKQSESLAEKLIHRFESSEDNGLWRDIAYCISQLPMTDKIVRKLAENIRSYKICLSDDDVWNSFSFMLQRAHKISGSSSSSSKDKDNTPKTELKQVIEEWEKALQEGRSGATEDDTALLKAQAAARRARRIALTEGIDENAITAKAMATAAASVDAAHAAALAEAEAAKKAKSKKTTTQATVPAPVVAPAPVVPAKPKKKGMVVDSDDEEEEVKPQPTKTTKGKKAPVIEDDDEEDEPVVSKGKATSTAAATKAKAPLTTTASKSNSSSTTTSTSGKTVTSAAALLSKASKGKL